MDFTEELKDFFLNHYVRDSLAYFGLSTKVENPFRDQFAFFLHEKYANAIVSREFSNGSNQRVDLAIIDKASKLKEFIEFKACYSFDLINNSNIDYKNEILKDNDKYVTEKDFNLTFILLSIRTDKCPNPDKYNSIVKYLPRMRAAYNKYSADQQKEMSTNNIKTWFSVNDLIQLNDYGTYDLGSSFEVKVYLDYFVMK